MLETETYCEWHADGKMYRAVFDDGYLPTCCHGNESCDRQEPGDAKSCQQFLDEEIADLKSGKLVALGVIVSELKPLHHCDTCSCPGESWQETDSLWGIVVEPGAEEIMKFVRECM